MIRITDIQDKLLHLVGWEQAYDPAKQIDASLTQSESGLMFQHAHPLLTLDNVVASAHAGGNTKDNDINMINYVYRNIVAFDEGRPMQSELDIVNAQYLK